MDKNTRYPEFGNLTRQEIETRLSTLEELLTAGANPDSTKVVRMDSEEKSSRRIEKTQEHDFWIIAHRGWSGSYPENTLIAFREAIKPGCHMIEFDVALSADRKPIIIHDDTLSRTTNAAGFVKDWNFKDLRELDAGSWFHPRFKGVRLPTLDEILLICRDSGIFINIEIKAQCWDEKLKKDSIENQIIKHIYKYGMQDRVIISSFRWSFIERIFSIDNTIKTALLHDEEPGQLKLKKLKKTYGCIAFNPFWIKLHQDFVNRAHDLDLKIFPYTVNSYLEMEINLDMGVDGVFTNHPDRLFRFAESQNKRLKELDSQEQTENIIDMETALQRLKEYEI